METVINDRTAITDVCGQKFLTKRTWPGSGKFGLEALEREQKNHVVVHHALQCMENDVLQVPEPVICGSLHYNLVSFFYTRFR